MRACLSNEPVAQLAPVLLILAAVQALGQSTGAVTVSPAQLQFPPAQVGSASAPADVTITNNTAKPVSGLAISVSGDYSYKTTCHPSLKAGAGCQISVTFAPTAAAFRSGKLTVTYTGQSAPAIVNLSGPAYALVSIVLTPQTASIPIGAGQQFHAVGGYSDGSTQNITSSVTWTSSNPTKLTVSNSGAATGIATGTARLTATWKKVSASANVNVTPATLLSLAVDSVRLFSPQGYAQQFNAVGSYSDGSQLILTNQVAWTSSTPSVASVSTGGLVSTLGPGTTLIKASLGSVASAADLTVTGVTLQSIAISPASLSMAKNTILQLQATGTYSDGSTRSLTNLATWSPSSNTVATVSSIGRITSGPHAGSAKVSASFALLTVSIEAKVTSARLTGITVSPGNSSLPVAARQQFTAMGAFSDGSSQDVSLLVHWTSSAPSIATVANSTQLEGWATARAVGSATITASYLPPVAGKTTLSVDKAALFSIAITPPNPAVATGKALQFKATGTFDDKTTHELTRSVTWSSGDPHILYVSNDLSAQGFGYGLAAGKTTVTATMGSVSGSTSFRVGAPRLISLSVSPQSATVVAGNAQNFTATGTYSDGSTQDLTAEATWSSSAPAVATVSDTLGTDGLALGISEGQATITATSGAISGSGQLIVTPARLVNITVTPANPTISVTGSQQFTATGTYTDSSTKNLTATATWSADPTSVATVSNEAGSQGLAHGVGPAQATITAALGTISGFTVLTVTAAPPQLTSISISPSSATVFAGSTQQFTATGAYSDGTTQDITTTVTWGASPNTVATISNAASSQGFAQALCPGSASITATLGTISAPPAQLSVIALLTGITVSPSSASIGVGSTQQFMAAGAYSDSSMQDLTTTATWSADPATVATISNATDSQGLAQAIGTGPATITASFACTSGSATLTVTPALISISVTPANPTVLVDKDQQFAATGTYSDASTKDLTAQVTWSAAPTSIATINASGLAHARAPGQATITAILGTISGWTYLNVSNSAPTLVSLAVSPLTPTIGVGGSLQFHATGTYTDGSTQDLTSTSTWASSTPAVATIASSGLATGLSVGTTTISATVGAITGSTLLTVTGLTLISLAVSPPNPVVPVPYNLQFTATGTYSNGTTQNLTTQVTWSISPPTVGVIGNQPGSQGLATIFGPGTATVTATLGSVSGSTSLTVNGGPTVTITSPTNLTFLNISPITVNGTVSDPNATVNVNGIAAPVSSGSFSVAVPLQEGNNIITAAAQSTSGLSGAASIQVTLDTVPPRVTIYTPSNAFNVTDSTITVTGIVNDTVVGTVNDQQVTVTVNGTAAQVANRSFLAPNIPLSPGNNTISVTGTDRAGNSYTTSISGTRNPPAVQPQIQLISGTNQTATVATQAAAPLVVAVTDATGHPASGVNVVFKVTQNNGSLQASGQQAGPTLLVPTGANGQAQATWTLGTHSGAASDIVQAYAVGYSGLINFTATATQAQPALIVIDSGNTQTGAAGQNLPQPLVAVVTDAGFNRLANVPVTFTVQQGGGNIGGQTAYSTTSDSDGRVQAVLTLGLQEGTGNNLITANFVGNTGFAANFTASGRVAGNAANTIVTGIVLDNSNNPLAGVNVRAVPLALLIQSPGSVSSLPAVQTNAQGQFTYPAAPVGSIKVMVDGSTARATGTYPSLEYDMVTIAGQTNSVGQPIYLLPLDTVNQLCVSETQGGTLTLAQSPGFSLTVLPGSATFPGGARQGCISVTPVHGDKVPMVPGFGQQPRFIVTIQPTGTLFNPPAAITLPNVDGLPPRSVTEMYSYDHDLSSFVSIGTGTVSADGTVIASNPGVGVLKAGWHCGGNPNTAGTVADCAACQYCNGINCVPDSLQTTCISMCITGTGLCQNGTCTGTPINCDDGNVCNGTETCDPKLGCRPGTPLNCDDGNACNGLETCNPASGCMPGTPLPDGASCNSGGTIAGVCLNGACTGDGPQCPATCDDGDPCTVDSCVNGGCVHSVDPDCQFCSAQSSGTPCGICRIGANCDGGVCTGGTPISGSCGPCMIGGTCSISGQCLGGTPVPNGTDCGSGKQCYNGFCSNPPVPTFTITKIWSNQSAEATLSNYLPGGSGSVATYVLMGSSVVGTINVGAQIQIDNASGSGAALVALFDRSSGSVVPSSSSPLPLVNGSASIQVTTTEGFVVHDYSVVVGVDHNHNGVLDVSEIGADSSFGVGYVKVVPTSAAALANGALSFYAWGGGWAQLTVASANLTAFLNGGVPSGAVLGAQNAPVPDPVNGIVSLSHHVGAAFDASGVARVPEYVFTSDSTAASEIRQSTAMQIQVIVPLLQVPANVNLIHNYFRSNPSATQQSFSFQLSAASIDFKQTLDLDLLAAFGEAALRNLTIGMSVIRSGTALSAQSFKIVDTDTRNPSVLLDVYDWDYDKGSVNSLGAEVQAKWLGVGPGGVFRTRVLLAGDVTGFSYSLPGL